VTTGGRGLLRRLADWSPAGLPITSIYLTVDGRRFQRKSDYELRLDELVRHARAAGEGLDRDARRSLAGDLESIVAFVRDRFERGSTRGIAMFSCSGAGLWEALLLPRPIRDRVAVGGEPDLLPLEALLETYPSICTVVVDHEKARVFIAALGRIEERSELWDDVPGRHDQGGWAQARFQRHVDEHRQKHLKRVAEALFRLFKRRSFDHMILAGPEEAVAELERELHDYLRRRVRARITLPMTASADDVLARSLAIEEELELDREREKVERVAQAAAGGGRGVAGLPATLGALAEGRIGELVVDIDLSVAGNSCASCGRLVEDGGACPACGGRLEPVPDVVEAAVARAIRSGCRVETVVSDAVSRLGGIGALLRF